MNASTIMKVVAGATAILTLVFAVERLVTSVTDARAKRAHTTELLRVASLQQHDGRYDEAWNTLHDGALDASDAAVLRSREGVAMEWLRNIHVTPPQETFSDVVRKVRPTLVQGTIAPDSARRADLTAHLGWADFLVSRDGESDVHPEEQYRRALALDPTNAYAHAMWGHWILWRRGPMADSKAQFAAAIRAGAHRDFVRELQVSALANLNDSTAAAELIRVANEMRAGGETAAPELRGRMADVICTEEAGRARSSKRGSPLPALVDHNQDRTAVQWLLEAMPPGDEHGGTSDRCRTAFQLTDNHR